MGVFLTLIAALALWVVVWAVDLMKSFDAFFIAVLIVLVAATGRVLLPYLPGGRH
jgi:hypothetical protein